MGDEIVKKLKKLCFIVSVCCSFFFVPGGIQAAPLDGSVLRRVDTAVNPNAVLSDNAFKNNYYEWSNWNEVVASYLQETSNGFERIEWVNAYDNPKVIVEKYAEDYTYQSRISLEPELPKFGGCYCGENYNYLFYGQDNEEENDAKEVIRIVQYSKQWERIQATGIYGANTIHPFDAGTLSCAEKDGYLYVRTCHEMYTSSDGLNHQANLPFILDEKSMQVTDCQYEVFNHEQSSWGYTSHSFSQLMLRDGNDIISVDHGDAHPRGIVLDQFPSIRGEFSSCNKTYASLVEFRGQTGDNVTDASLGGIEASEQSYLVVGNYLKNASDHYRSIWLSVVSKNNVKTNELIYITDGTKPAATPVIVKVNQNRFMIAWNEIDCVNDIGSTDSAVLNYVFVDGQGNKLSEIMKSEGDVYLSDCTPIVKGNHIIWYATKDTVPVFYEINTQDYHISNRPVLSNVLIQFGSTDVDLHYIGEDGTFVKNQIFEADHKKYFADDAGNIAVGLFEYKGKFYYAKKDGALACSELVTFETWYSEDTVYAKEDCSLLANASIVKGNVKYYFGKEGIAQNFYRLSKKQSIVTYKKDVNDKYGVYTSDNVTIPKKVTVKKGNKLYLCNADLNINAYSDDTGRIIKKYDSKLQMDYFKVYKNATVTVQLKMNGKMRSYKVKVKVKKEAG